MDARLVWVTPDAEKVIAYCARVSSPHQDNPHIAGLLRYCIMHGHWSVCEMASMCCEITTSRAISAQILRHRSFSFQEFSQRYAAAQTFEAVFARKQAEKNRQSSTDDLDREASAWFIVTRNALEGWALEQYQQALEKGIAKESARFLLPMTVQTRLFMAGTLRSWVHYLQLRTQRDTQLEHREIAEALQAIFIGQFPILSEALGWRVLSRETTSVTP